MPLYLYLLIGSLIVPLLYSIFFNDFIKYWKEFSISTIVVAALFLIWDYYFTKAGIWGFNYNYCLGLKIFEMPIEEWLFFIIIPFCSLFIHFAFLYVWPTAHLNKKPTYLISFVLIAISIFLVALNYTKGYTLASFMILILTILYGLLYHRPLLQKFYITFLIILIPFFIINGTLTGSFIETPIVWYNNKENLGIRLTTIPIEDIAYCFSLLFGNLMIFEKLKFNKIKRNT